MAAGHPLPIVRQVILPVSSSARIAYEEKPGRVFVSRILSNYYKPIRYNKEWRLLDATGLNKRLVVGAGNKYTYICIELGKIIDV